VPVEQSLFQLALHGLEQFVTVPPGPCLCVVQRPSPPYVAPGALRIDSNMPPSEFRYGVVMGKLRSEQARRLVERRWSRGIESTYLSASISRQEVAYNSVLIERRRQLHQRTAEAIEALFGDTINNHLDDLAHHYRRAGNADKSSD